MKKKKQATKYDHRHKNGLPLYFILLALMLLSGVTAYSQSASVKASINRDKILIGEPIELKLEAVLPSGQSATWFPLDSIPRFEFIEKGRIDTLEENGGFTYKQTLTITSFDSGRWVIPAFGLDLNGRSYLTDSLPVSVAFSEFDANQPYHDIKDILPVKTTEQRYLVWTIIALTVISLLMIIYLLRKPVSKLEQAPKRSRSTASPLEEALKALNELRAQRLAESGNVKAYYTGMNDILRSFITRKSGFSVLEKTSEELLLQLRDRNLKNDDFIELAQTLRMSDAVKFAKFVPSQSDNDHSFDVFKNSIEILNNL